MEGEQDGPRNNKKRSYHIIQRTAWCVRACVRLRVFHSTRSNESITPKEVPRLLSFNNEDTQPVIRAIVVSHTACKDEFRQNL